MTIRRIGNRGFTLIEMMIVVAIIAIIAAVAYPSYTNYVLRTRRADGKEFMMRVAAAQERYYTRLNRYTDEVDDLGIGGDASDGGFYSVAIALGDGDQSYTLTATPEGLQAKDQCGDLTLTNTGQKDWAGAKPPTNGNCW